MGFKSTFLISIIFLSYFSTLSAQSNALHFDGANQYVQTASAFNIGSGDFTFEVWVKPATTAMGMIFAQDIGGDVNHQFRLHTINTTADFAFSGAGGNPFVQVITPAGSVPTNEWTHIAVTRSAGTITTYINGILSATGNSTTIDNQSGADATKTFRIAARGGTAHPNGQNNFNGSIDELRYWNIARTSAQIKANLFQAPLANASGLVAMYKFDAGSGTSLVNSCSNSSGINGTLINGPVWTASPIVHNENAINLDGANDVVAIGAPTATSSSFTREAWVNIPSHAGNLNIISSSSSPFWISGGRLNAGLANNFSLVVDPGVFPLNSWVHVAVTFDDPNNTMRLYRDGVLVSSNTGIVSSYTAENTFIGSHAGSQSFFNGHIDEVRFWNVARTQVEIQNTRFTELTPENEPNLAAYYTFNQGVVAGDNTGLRVVPDKKGNFNGVMNNFSLNGGTSNYIAQNNALITLPVLWKEFTATMKESKVLLQWSTEYELNTSSFTVQHRTAATEWKDLYVSTAAGNSNSTHYYNYIHPLPSPGINYYRILQTDLNGSFNYSEVKRVSMQTGNKPFVVTGNLITNGSLQVRTKESMQVLLYNRIGQLILRQQLAPGTHEISLQGLKGGIYFLHAGNVVEKVVVQ